MVGPGVFLHTDHNAGATDNTYSHSVMVILRSHPVCGEFILNLHMILGAILRDSSVDFSMYLC